MKRLLLIFAVVLVTSCSFDNKTGIWKDGTDINQDYQSPKTITNNNLNTKYEDIFTKNIFIFCV